MAQTRSRTWGEEYLRRIDGIFAWWFRGCALAPKASRKHDRARLASSLTKFWSERTWWRRPWAILLVPVIIVPRSPIHRSYGTRCFGCAPRLRDFNRAHQTLSISRDLSLKFNKHLAWVAPPDSSGHRGSQFTNAAVMRKTDRGDAMRVGKG